MFFLPLTAQDITLTFENYGVEDGLSHRQVNAIHQDRQGFIWAGTQYGLNRFDGYQFKWWTKEKNGLFSNTINVLTEDANGLLWIIYHIPHPTRRFFFIKHIDLLDPETGVVTDFATHLGKDFPVDLYDVYADFRVRGPDQSIYMGTNGGARLIRYHPNRGFQIIPIGDYRSFFPLAMTAGGEIWGIANEKTLLKINLRGDSLQALPYTQELHHRQIAYDGRYLWIQLGGESLPATFQKVDGQDGTVTLLDYRDFQVPDQYAANGHQKIMFDAAHSLIWGLSRYPYITAFSNQDGQVAWNIPEKLAEFIKQGKIGIRSFVVDDARKIWFGGDFGLSSLEQKPQKFKNYLSVSDPSKPTDAAACRGIVRVGKYLLVVTDRNGLYKVDLSVKEAPSEFNLVPSAEDGKPVSNSILGLPDHAIWMTDATTLAINPTNDSIHSTENARNFNNGIVWAMYRDAYQRIWLGRETGLAVLDPAEKTIKAYQNYGPYTALANARVIEFVEDKAGFLWVCTNEGLFILEPVRGILAHYWTGGANEFYLPHDDIRHLHQDEAGIYWLASGGGGLIRWDREKQEIRQFTRADGLSNNALYAIYEDNHQHLWMSSDLGIIQFDKETHQVQTFLEQDGITHNEFNRTSHYQDSTGRIYFGGLNGVTSFDPEDFYANEKVRHAPLVITDFQQFDGSQNKLVDRKAALLKNKEIILRPDDRFFYLSFALLTYSNPEQIGYAYQIVGWDDDWQYQRERTLRLGRLPYGKHLLKIKAQADNGQWSPHELHIPITVLKPFYWQWWFLVLLIGLLLVSLFFAYRFNLRRQLEKREARQLKEFDALKTNFYNNITHEFRTPLTVILGMTEQIRGHEKERQLINRNSKKLLRLINQLLDLAKLESGHMNVELVQGNIISYLRYLTESFHSVAVEKQILLIFEATTPELIMDFDEEKVQYIVYNLLSNALKFTPENGRVAFQVTQLLRDGQPCLQLQVMDTGVGIPPDQLPHIFDRFYQADHTATQKGEGTGIGLAFTKELVELMGGQISVESPGQVGTTFTIHLPIVQNPDVPEFQGDTTSSGQLFREPNGADAPEETNDWGVVSRSDDIPLLLIIEDNADVVAYVESLLKKDYRIEKAFDGAEGIRKALEMIPDIVITDVMMPKKDGYEVCQTLKTDERTSHIPIIMLTARATAADRITALKTGADAYLTKPFNKKELFVRLEKLVELRRALQKHYAQAAGQLFENADISTQQEPTPNDLFLQKIYEIINQKIADADLDVDYLCQAAYLSTAQLYRKMKALTGEPPMSFIRKVRLYKARELLQSTDSPVSDIAYNVGFTDPNYFSRAFSKEFGTSPSSWRK